MRNLLRIACLLVVSAPLTTFAQIPTCNGKPATITVATSGTTTNGTKYPDVIVGSAGDDIIYGLSGNDTICGGGGNDSIYGGNGNEWIDGGYGNDLLDGEFGTDELRGDLGNDTLVGGIGVDVCDGGVGQDTAAGCEATANLNLRVKSVQLLDDDGFALDGALLYPDGPTKKVAVLATHGASGRFSTGLVGWVGWWGELYGLTTLSLNRRDSIAYGANEGGGTTLFPTTVCDLKAGVDYLISLGFEKVLLVGHSKGTQHAVIYPVYFRSCGADVAGSPDLNDFRVAGVANFGQIADGREAAQYAPYQGVYNVILGVASNLVANGQGDLLWPVPTQFGPVTILQTSNSWLSYYGPDTLAVPEREGQALQLPVLIVHVDNDNVTPKPWSDRMSATLATAGINVTYLTPGYSQPTVSPGFAEHSIDARVSRDAIFAQFAGWLNGTFPSLMQDSTSVSIPSLPDFVPALAPTPPNP
jgi:pimeloyl-ACP methyl ester carboxylesterase